MKHRLQVSEEHEGVETINCGKLFGHLTTWLDVKNCINDSNIFSLALLPLIFFIIDHTSLTSFLSSNLDKFCFVTWLFMYIIKATFAKFQSMV